MSYIKFDKQQLVNLEYSLQKELLRSNRAGSYSSTTITGCNTRKYHGLLVSLQPKIDNQHHVLLSSFDETVIQHETEFNLGIHKYEDDVYEPGGHKYIRDFESEPIPKLTYRVGGVVLSKERVFGANDDRILIKYTLEEANSPTKLRFKPYCAFRSVHDLSRANDDIDTSFIRVQNGVQVRLYEHYSPLFMQFSKKVNYIHNPNWYYGIEYSKEKTRGYDYKEDLFVPGYFEISIKQGESFIFSAGLEEVSPAKLKSIFEKERQVRIPRDSFENCLINTAQQFFVQKKDKIDLIAGYHWFNISGRDTFISLPGLSLTQNDQEAFLSVVDSLIKRMDGPFFPSNRIGSDFIYEAVDGPLWFFWALQQYILFTGDESLIWKKYQKIMLKILNAFYKGTSYNIHVQENGLLYAGFENDALTWMNVKMNDVPVINRNGLAVEVNALWYNAIRFYSELGKSNKETSGLKKWNDLAQKIEGSFMDTFWDEEKGYMADVVRGEMKDFSVRPNQVFACSLPYCIPDEGKIHRLLQVVESELLTPRGIRTLSPKNLDYKGIYKGDIFARDSAYHQGSAFPWLLGHFAQAYLEIHGKSGLGLIQKIYSNFEEEMTEAGIGTISELYYGDPPYKGKGAISQAWSVAELLRINHLIKQYEQNTNQS